MAYSPGTPFRAGEYIDMVAYNGFLYASRSSAAGGGMQKIDPITAAVVDSGPRGNTHMGVGFGSIWCGSSGNISRVNPNDLSSFVDIPLIVDGANRVMGFSENLLITHDRVYASMLGDDLDMVVINPATNAVAAANYPFPGAYYPEDTLVRSDSNVWSAGTNPAFTTQGINKWNGSGRVLQTHFPLGNSASYSNVGYGSNFVYSYSQNHDTSNFEYPYNQGQIAQSFVQRISPETNFVDNKIEIPFLLNLGGSDPVYDAIITYGSKRLVGVVPGDSGSVWFNIRHEHGGYYPGILYINQLWRFNNSSGTFTDVWPPASSQVGTRGTIYQGLSSAVAPTVYLQPQQDLVPFFIAPNYPSWPSASLPGIYRLYGSPTPPPPPPPVSTAGIFIKDYRIGGSIGT